MWKMWRGNELMKIINDGAKAGVFQTCDAIVKMGKGEVPLNEGSLRNTGKVIMDPSGKPAGCATFGGGPGTGYPVIPYAIKWHEKSANFQHGRKRFYLRDPFNKLSKKLPDNIARKTGELL